MGYTRRKGDKILFLLGDARRKGVRKREVKNSAKMGRQSKRRLTSQKPKMVKDCHIEGYRKVLTGRETLGKGKEVGKVAQEMS